MYRKRHKRGKRLASVFLTVALITATVPVQAADFDTGGYTCTDRNTDSFGHTDAVFNTDSFSHTITISHADD